MFDIDGENFTRTYAISLTPLKGVIKDYLMICDSYYQAIRTATPDRSGGAIAGAAIQATQQAMTFIDRGASEAGPPG